MWHYFLKGFPITLPWIIARKKGRIYQHIKVKYKSDLKEILQILIWRNTRMSELRFSGRQTERTLSTCLLICSWWWPSCTPPTPSSGTWLITLTKWTFCYQAEVHCSARGGLASHQGGHLLKLLHAASASMSLTSTSSTPTRQLASSSRRMQRRPTTMWWTYKTAGFLFQ